MTLEEAMQDAVENEGCKYRLINKSRGYELFEWLIYYSDKGFILKHAHSYPTGVTAKFENLYERYTFRKI